MSVGSVPLDTRGRLDLKTLLGKEMTILYDKRKTEEAFSVKDQRVNILGCLGQSVVDSYVRVIVGNTYCNVHGHS